jgi:hypothetical protein
MMNTLHPPRAEDRAKRPVCAEAASPVQGLSHPIRFALAAEHTRPSPGYYLILMRQHLGKTSRPRLALPARPAAL